MNKLFLFIIVFFYGLLVPSIVLSQDAESASKTILTRPDADQGSTTVSVGIWIISIDSINSVEQNFNANVFVVLQWKDPRLAFSEKTIKKYQLIDIWNPQIEIVNEVGQVNKTLPAIVDVESDGTVTYRQRYAGAFSQSFKLNDFPFDKQVFRIHLVSIGSSANEIQFKPNDAFIAKGFKKAAGLSHDIALHDWTIESYDAKSLPFVLAPQSQIPGYIIEFSAVRKTEYYILKVILPLILIIMMSWTVFWIDSSELETQVNVATTSMLTLIAYRFAVDSLVPRIPYMTRLDKFIFISTILIFLSLLQVIVTENLTLKGKKALVGKIDTFSKVFFPSLFIIASYISFIW